MASKKRTAAAPASHQHQRESAYLSHAQKKVFGRPTPRVAKVAPSEAKTPRKKAAKKAASRKSATRKRAAKTANAPGVGAAAE